ncbi:MAG: excinuclease ABC subunit UvrA [Deltaproteobacteria bacterium]|nr:excinuclease ABC subunit UvrA [Deltaproteobacteria bacterium]
MVKYIKIRGAQTHNLKNIDIDIPREQFVVITGPSGSGKSTLAFDTLFAEGQRRYVESLSPGARQFISQLPKPDVVSIEGLSPTVAISQYQTGKNPRSTVGTASELYDYLRLLFARCGQPHCPVCKVPVTPLSIDQIVDQIKDTIKDETRFSVLSPAVKNQKGDLKTVLNRLRKDGYVRVDIDNDLYDLSDEIKLNKNKNHDLNIYIDRLVMSKDIANRLADSIELALKESGGLVIISPINGDDLHFTSSHSCIQCGKTAPVLEPSDFSFNSPDGACPECSGLGMKMFFEESKIIPNAHLSIKDGAIDPWSRRNSTYYQELLGSVTSKYGIDPFKPWKDLTEKQRDILLNGTDDELEFTVKKTKSKMSFKKEFEGIIQNLERRSQEYERRKKDSSNNDDGDYLSDEFARYMSTQKCKACNGARLKPESLHVTVGDKNIAEVSHLSIEKVISFFDDLKLPARQALIADSILKEIKSRLQFLNKVGLEYISLDRSVFTLSGGEAQRIRLANQIGSSLVGVTYVLDEPSIGLHQRDHERLLETLKELKERGNTVIVVEHDPDTMLAADYLIDMGPLAGVKGGEIVSKGTPAEVKKDPDSLTGAYLSGRKFLETPQRLRQANSRSIMLNGATANNLKNISVKIPLGLLVTVTGVSGSGKSSLIMDTLLPAAKQILNKVQSKEDIKCDSLTGLYGNLDKVIAIDQAPIGRTPRSNPATFTGVFSEIRELFASMTESKMKGYKAGRYSFNVKGGRCEACQGDGMLKVEMNFLPDTFVTCEVCKGSRYNRETLEITYKGKNIAEILNMTCNQAYDFLENQPKIRQKLMTLRQVGLGYLKLGQNAATLSGGEAQRLKLAKELSKKSTGSTLYIMDEPTTGLHFDDIRLLLDVINKLIDQGNSVVIIEHNLDIIKSSDWIIDIGPEGGEKGGEIAAVGTPADIVKAGTHTGRYLKNVI